MKIGYARVSTVGQSLDVQLDKLNHCEKVFKEKVSASTGERPQLTHALDFVREGDTLVITKLDRLARSTLHLTQIADRLEKKGVQLQVLDQSIDTTTKTGRLLFNMLASIAEFETEIRKERQMEGIAIAKKKGVKFGAKAKLSDEQVEQMRVDRKDLTVPQLTKKYNISKASIYRLL